MLLVGVVLLTAAGAAVVWHVRQHTAEPNKPVLKRSVTPKQPAEGVTSHLQFVGDVFWGRRTQTAAEQSGKGYSYITSGLSIADRSNYDAWIANFECPITTKDVPYDLQVNILKFNCRPEYLPELAKWFTAASQANNHTENNDGIWGLDQTRANLQNVGIQNFSTYDMNQTNDLCEVITMPATTTVKHQKVSIPVAMCGYMYVVDVTPTDAQLAVMQQYARVMPVVAMPHMGVEYRATAEPEKISAYHRMIDNGADMVVGAHPHVIQNSEVYKGKLIAYSVGNFLFDQQRLGREESVGLGVGLKITIKDAQAAKVYEQVAPTCKIYKDDCLAALQSKLPQRPAMTVSYNFSCYDETAGVPKLGSTDDCTSSMQTASIDQLQNLSTTW